VSGELTGRHVLAILGLFFLSMFVANGALVYFALSTLHGSELENPYDASQSYNRAIADARAQDEREWTADVTTRAEGRGERITVEFRDRAGAAIAGLQVTARLRHPFDAAQDRETKLSFNGLAYEGVATPVAPGRWILVIEASRGPQRLYRSENRIAADAAAN
jgi:nitrogen fixation protein FixH